MFVLTMGNTASAEPAAPTVRVAERVSAALQAGQASVGFAGYDWQIKTADSPVGPGPNRFTDDPQSIWVDDNGALHMRVRKIDGAWRATELIGPTLGHGTYTWTTSSDLTTLAPNLVLGMFTWSDDPTDANREIDIEVSRWGALAQPHLYWVVAPGLGGDRTSRTRHEPVPSGQLRHTMTWKPDRIDFSVTGNGVNRTWTYTGPAIPSPGDAATRINLWIYNSDRPGNGTTEVTITDFTHTPLTPAPDPNNTLKTFTATYGPCSVAQ